MPQIIDYAGTRYELTIDTNIGACGKCVAASDKVLCAAIGAYCDGGYFVAKRGPGRPRKKGER